MENVLIINSSSGLLLYHYILNRDELTNVNNSSQVNLSQKRFTFSPIRQRKQKISPSALAYQYWMQFVGLNHETVKQINDDLSDSDQNYYIPLDRNNQQKLSPLFSNDIQNNKQGNDKIIWMPKFCQTFCKSPTLPILITLKMTNSFAKLIDVIYVTKHIMTVFIDSFQKSLTDNPDIQRSRYYRFDNIVLYTFLQGALEHSGRIINNSSLQMPIKQFSNENQRDLDIKIVQTTPKRVYRKKKKHKSNPPNILELPDLNLKQKQEQVNVLEELVQVAQKCLRGASPQYIQLSQQIWVLNYNGNYLVIKCLNETKLKQLITQLFM